MEGNPYARALELIQHETGAEPIRIRLGTVVKLSPFIVRVGGLELPSSEFRMDKRLSGALKAGSRLLLLTEDDQIYYIICEVINA